MAALMLRNISVAIYRHFNNKICFKITKLRIPVKFRIPVNVHQGLTDGGNIGCFVVPCSLFIRLRMRERHSYFPKNDLVMETS